MKPRKPIKRTRIKAKRLTPVNKLQKKAEGLWKEIAYKRDGRECQVKKFYPQIGVEHTEVMQVDHGMSRTNKETFLEIANATVLCSGCNLAKYRHQKSVEWAVLEIIKSREGIDTFNRLNEINMRKGGFKNWSSRMWLEGQIAILEEMLRNM